MIIIEPMIENAIHWLLNLLAAPEVGLTSVFIISFVSATLVPLGSEPAVFAVCKANPSLFWPAMAVESNAKGIDRGNVNKIVIG